MLILGAAGWCNRQAALVDMGFEESRQPGRVLKEELPTIEEMLPDIVSRSGSGSSAVL